MKMKALILSGGKGTRLRPITHTGAKQLIPVANRPILAYVLENIAKAGVKDVGMIISPETGEEIKMTIGDGAKWGLSIHYITQKEPKGLAHAVSSAHDFLGDSPFIMYLGDNLIGCGIEKFVQTFNKTKADAVILLKPVDNPSAFGVAEIDSKGKIITLQEKPEKPASNLALVGVYIFSPKIHECIESITPSKRGELEITDAIQALVKGRNSVHSNILDTWWLDTGKKDDLLNANTIVLDEWIKRDIAGQIDTESQIRGRVKIEQNAIIKNSTLRGPIVIGEGTVIEDSFVGPFTSIGANSIIKQSVIENSVILEGVEINHIDRMEDSLIGRNAKLMKSNNNHQAYRLMVGDDSVVEV